VQVEQGQHLGDLRGLPRPRRQDRGGDPLPLTGVRVGALVGDPGDGHLDRARAGQDLPRLVIAVADHQPAAIFATLGGMRRDIGVHLGPQRLGQHPPGAFPHDLINQRRRAVLAALVARAVARDYREHRVVPSRPARQRRSLLETRHDHREGTPTSPAIHRSQALLRVAARQRPPAYPPGRWDHYSAGHPAACSRPTRHRINPAKTAYALMVSKSANATPATPRRSQSGPRPWGALGDTDPGRVATPGKGYACGWNNGTLNSPLIYRRKHRQPGASAGRGLPGVTCRNWPEGEQPEGEQYDRGSGSVSS